VLLKRRKLIGGFGIAFATLAVLATAAWLTVTSSWFLKATLLPRVEEATGLEITTGRLKLSLRGRLEAQHVRVSRPTATWHVEGERLVCLFSPAAALDGTPDVASVTVAGMSVRVAPGAEDGPTWDLTDGTLELNDYRPGATVTAKFQFRAQASDPPKVHVRDGQLTGRLEGALGPRGDLRGGQVAIRLADLQGHAGAIELEGKTLGIKLHARPESDGRVAATGELTLTDCVALALKADGGLRPLAVSNCELTVTQFHLGLADLLLPERLGARITQGTLHGRLQLRGTGDGNERSLTGALAAREATVETDRHRLDDLGASLTVEADIAAGGRLTVKGTTVDLVVGSRTAIRTVHEGALDLTGMTGGFRHRITEINEAVMGVVPPEWLGGVHLRRLVSRGTVRTTFGGRGEGVAVEGRIEVPSLLAIDPEFGLLPPTQSTLEFRADCGRRGISLQAAEFKSRGPDGPLAQLTATGFLALPFDAGMSRLALRSEHIDLAAAAGFVYRLGGGVDGERQGLGDPDDERSRRNDSRPIDLRGLDLTVNADLRRLAYADIDITNCVGNARVRNNIVTVQELTAVINGAPARGRATIDLAALGCRYTAEGSVGPLDIEPFLTSLAEPDIAQQIDARIERVGLRIAGQGTDRQALAENLTGRVEIVLDSLTIRDNPSLARAAAQYGIPELQVVQFDGGRAQLLIGAGEVAADELFVAGPDLRVDGAGSMDTDLQLDVTFALAVAGNLQSRLVAMGLPPALMRELDGYRLLPVTIPVTGPLTDPRTTITVEGVMQQLLTNVGTQLLDSVLRPREAAPQPER